MTVLSVNIEVIRLVSVHRSHMLVLGPQLEPVQLGYGNRKIQFFTSNSRFKMKFPEFNLIALGPTRLF